MKIIECYIENFGKLSNFSYKFENGLNVINKSNGFGKTTFANFIKAMFYGLEPTNKRTTSLTDRKKYKPWQKGNFGGNLVFEIESKKYKVERFFGDKEIEDTFKIYDLETNLESSKFTSNLGEEIFKINKEAYERSTYIPQQKLTINMNDSISAKLGNVLESENDVNTSEKAIKVLTENIKKYKKTGGRGLIEEKKILLSELNRKLENAKSDELILDERKKQLEEIREKIKQYEKEKNNNQQILNQKMEQDLKKEKLERYEELEKQQKEIEQMYKNLNLFFKEDLPKNEELETLISKCLEIEKYKIEVANCNIESEDLKKLEYLENVFKDNKITQEQCENKITEYNELKDLDTKIDYNNIQKENYQKNLSKLKEESYKDNKISKIMLVIIFIGLAISIMGIIMKIEKIFPIISVVGTLACIAVYIVKSNSTKKSKNDIEQLENKLREINNIIENINEKKRVIIYEIDVFINKFINKRNNNIIIDLTEIRSNIIQYQELCLKRENALNKKNNFSNKLNLLEESIKEYLSKYFIIIDKSYSTLAQDLKIKKKELENVQMQLKKVDKIKEEYEKNINIEELKNQKFVNIDTEQIKTQFSILTQKINKLNDEKNYNKNQIELLENKIEEIQDIERDIEKTKIEINEAEEKYNILVHTKKYLEKSKEQFSSHYLNGMTKGFEKYLKLIDNTELKTNIDVKLDVKIEEYGSEKSVDFMSAGYKDLIYICMRFSLVNALFENEKPFIILDDPFVNLDKEKLNKALDLLKQIAKEYQVIYFICHDSRNA